MRKIIFAVLKPKFTPSFLKQSNKSLYFSSAFNSYFSTTKENEEVKLDSQDSHDDFKPKVKPTPEYETFYPEIEKVFKLIICDFK